MKIGSVFAAAIGAASLFAGTAVPFASVAQAGNADFCLVARERGNGGQELYNRCQEPVEAAWCHYDDNYCARFNNSWTIGPQQSYPVESGTMLYAACRGANSIARISRTFLECA